MIAQFFNRWEHRLASVDTNRVVRPFDWGLDWLGLEAGGADPGTAVGAWSDGVMADTAAFFHAPLIDQFDQVDQADRSGGGDVVRFPSALTTPDAVNNVVTIRVFPAQARAGRPRRAVVVLPQWNADAGGHVGLCRLFARFGVTAVRLTLPYHESRKPPDLERADYIVSANVGRTAQVNRQAVLDARRAIDWLAGEGYTRIGIMGTSLGSCLGMLTMAHDARVTVGAFNHVSPYFADVVWRGLSTRHVRAGLEGSITLDELRRCWMPISPWPFIEQTRGRRVLLVYAAYDSTFPPDLSRRFIDEFTRRGVPHDTRVLPCGHYTTGKAPFKFLDAYYLTRFLVKHL